MTGTSSPIGFWVGLIGLAVIMAIIFILVGRAERARHERNRVFAVTQGWDYLPVDPFLVSVAHSHPFGMGRGRTATDAIRGTHRNRQFVLFNYRFVTGSGKNRKEYNYVVLVVEVPGHIPVVRIGPEHVGTKIMAAFGADDVEVESEEFNRRWFVAAQDPRAAHALLTPRMIERFLDDDLNWRTVAFEPGLIVTSSRGKLDLSRTMPPFDTVCDIADLVPPFLAQDYPGWDSGG